MLAANARFVRSMKRCATRSRSFRTPSKRACVTKKLTCCSVTHVPALSRLSPRRSCTGYSCAYGSRANSAQSAEYLAGDMATHDDDKRRYVEELLTLAQFSPRAVLSEAAGLGVLGSRHDFTNRMETLLMRRSKLATRCSLPTLLHAHCAQQPF